MKALALFSGGLDSLLAAKMVMDQGVEVIPVNMVSHFFGGDDKARRAAKQLGLEVREHVFSERHLQMLKNPKYGYGRHVNPCIDCHGLMLRFCAELMPMYDARFVVTGEVLGQRPKSQTREALAKVDRLSGIGTHTLRPLSALLLPETAPEELKWVNRAVMRDISGRHRDVQYQMAKDYGFDYIPSPGGGCCLTDPEFSFRLKSVLNDGMDDNASLLGALKHGRVFQNGVGAYIIVGRNRAENIILQTAYAKDAEHVLTDTPHRPGPTILVFTKKYEGDGTGNLTFAKHLFARYCSAKNKDNLPVMVNGKLEDTGVQKYTVQAMNAYHKHVKHSRNDEFKVKFKNRLSTMMEPAKSRLDDELNPNDGAGPFKITSGNFEPPQIP